jgi:hypothetical protein
MRPNFRDLSERELTGGTPVLTRRTTVLVAERRSSDVPHVFSVFPCAPKFLGIDLIGV